MLRTVFLPLLALTLSLPLASAAEVAPPADAGGAFEIRAGDRVLLVGDTLLERENTYGFLEERLDAQFPDRQFTVRNLSWSGDTPTGVSRAMFDGPAKGWERLKEEIAALKPTVVFLGYGMAASLQEITDRSQDITLNPDPVRYGRDPMTAARFKTELGQLMDLVNAALPGGGTRFVLLAPLHHEDLRSQRSGLPDPAAHNQLLAAYSQAIKDLAAERGGRFVPLDRLAPTGAGAGAQPLPLTSNGIHLGENGYRALAEFVAEQLGWSPGPRPPAPTASAATPASPLRAAIIRKNQLFFHRFRPENWTYLFGFRKGEQGKNAVEIPKFDPLIAQLEQEIERLKKAPPEAAAAAPISPAPTPAPPAVTESPSLNFDVQKGFQIDLWATNPLLEKPVGMNWDSDGRLWIASSNTYPQVNPEDVATSLAAEVARGKDAPSAGNDKILILADPGHTGKAAHSSVFAEGLLIPTAVAPFLDAAKHWGCYVGASTELVELTDTTGAGRADRRRIILSGFGTEDTHHIVHTLRWGPDGRLNFDQSIYIHSHFETPWGMVRLNSAGILTWDPRTERVEVAYKGFCNPWGHAWDEWGQEFMTDGAGGEGVAWGIPEAMYFTYENGRKLAPSISPGSYPKFCALEIIHSPLFPEPWQGSMITNDFRAHRIVHFGVNDLSLGADPAKAQSGYVTKELPDLVRTDDLSFRPIDVKLGPDGGLYVADWSNPVINHGEVDFRDPRRDHHRGRIWRIAQSDKAPLKWEPLTGKPAPALLPKLLSENQWEKEQARRALAQEPLPDASAALKQWWQEAAANPGATAGRSRAAAGEVFASFGLTEATNTIVAPALAKDADARIRALACRQASGASLKQIATQLISDPSARVRLDAMRALCRFPTGQSAALVLDAAFHAPAGDPFYDYASWLSINDLAGPWTQAVSNGEWKVEGHEKQLEFALNAIDPALASEALGKVLTARGIPEDGGPWIELLAKAGSPADLRKLFDALAGEHLNGAASERAIGALREAARLRNARPAGDLAEVATLLSKANPRISAAAARLMGIWKLPKATEVLNDLAAGGTHGNSPLEVRLAAIEGLREAGGEAGVAALQALTKPAQPLEIRSGALVALMQINLGAGIAAAADVLPAITDPAAAGETWRAMLQIKDAAAALAKRLPPNLPSATAAAGLRVARESGKPGEALATALAASAGAPAEANTPPKDYRWMVDFVKKDGDPARGELVFRQLQLACVNCHAIGGVGGKVGPDLTSLGASAPLDYIIESVIAPNAKVKEGFNAVSLTLKDGTVAVGIPVRETPQEFFLRTIAGTDVGVPKANVVSRENIGSIMPPGLVDAIPERDRWNLYAFLAQLGKPGIYDASKGAVARFWAIYPAKAVAGGIVDPTYKGPVGHGNTLVSGRLTKEQLQQAIAALPEKPESVVAVARFQAPAAGTVNLSLSGVGIKDFAVDGKPPTAAESPTGNFSAPVEVAAGEHTITVRLDPASLPEALRAECPEVRFLGD